MLSLQTIELARATIKHLGDGAAGAVIVMTKAFGLELGRELNPEAGEEGCEPEEIAGLPVVYSDAHEVPALLTAAGKLHNILPTWAREGHLLNQETTRIILPH